MKAKQFNKEYEINPNKNGLTATRKTKLPPRKKQKIFITANGKPFIYDKEYFFFDVQSKKVRTSQGLKADGEFLTSLGWKVVKLDKLRTSKDNAINDAQLFYLEKMKIYRQEVEKLEREKSPDARSLKNVLMAKDV